MPITGGRWVPGSGVTVQWSNGKSFPLDSGAQWDGLNAGPSMVNHWQRYAGGKQDQVQGSFMRSIGEETQGGEAFSILQELFRKQGITRDPDRQEFYDFAIENSPGRTLRPEDRPRFLGPGGGGESGILNIPATATGPQIKRLLTEKQVKHLTTLLKVERTELPPLIPAERRVEELRTVVLNNSGKHDLPPEVVAMLSPENWLLAKPYFVKALKSARIVRKLAGDPRPIPD